MTMKPRITEIAAMAEPVFAAGEKSMNAAANSFNEGMAQATGGIEQTQTKMKEGMEKAMKTAEAMVSFSQGNVEAIMRSSQIWAAGVQDLSRQFAATAQASMDETVSTFRAMTGVRSLKDAMDLQSNLARTTLDKTLSESGRLTDASFKLSEQAIAPLTARLTLAVEKFARPV